MEHPEEEFDALYKDVRDRLLVEAYALTGDLTVSRTAVRDAFAVAWHHWNTVQRVDDPVAWLRPHVWRRARNRHTARPWHRERHLPEGVAATLEALDELPLNERKALVLTHLSPVPPAQMAREIGVTSSVAQALVTSGTDGFARARGCEVDAVGSHLAELRIVEGGRWPRSSIVRRTGTARRRAYALGGVMAAVALVVASGTFVAGGGDDDATLSEQGFDRRPVKVDPSPDLPQLSTDTLLEPGQLTRVDRRLSWTAGETHDNTSGNGLVLPCQRASFADPDGLGAYVRTFQGTPRKKKGGARPASAVEMVELSRTADEAKAAFATATDWFAACNAPRTQLLSAYALPGVGDQAVELVLRTWQGRQRTVQVGVARTGQVTTTVVTDADGVRRQPRPTAAVLGAAVNALCGSPGAGTCSTAPKPKPRQVPAAGVVPGMLSEFDLPPMAAARETWAGTPATEAGKQNLAATRCDETSFAGKNVRNDLTRTFLFLKAQKRNPTFGLTQTAGVLGNANQARKFVEGVRNRVARCADEDLGTDVTRIVDRRRGKNELTAWRLVTELPGDRTLDFYMAIMRHGDTVSQVGFVPTGKLQMSTGDFISVAERALVRLPRLKLEDGSQE